MDPKTGWASNQTVCRCCLAEGCYKDISTEYFWMGKREVYSEMLSDTFDISISFPTVSSTTTSRLICEPCISRLRDASEFKKQVQDCEKTFVQHLDTVETGIELDVREPDPIPLMEPVLKVVKIEQVKMEKAESDDEYVPSADDMDDDHLNDDDDDDLDDEPLTKLASKRTKTPKTEPEPEPKASKRKITIKLKEPAKKPKVAAKIVSKAKPKPTTSKVLAKPQSDKKSKAAKPDDVYRWNAEILLKFTTACPFRIPLETMKCTLCDEEFELASECRKHYRTHKVDLKKILHPVSSEYYLKLDCTDVSCRLCKEKFNKLNDVAVHLKEVHRAKLNLDNGLHVFPYVFRGKLIICNICDKSLYGIRTAGVHIASHFPNHVCTTCGKQFLSSGSLFHHKKRCGVNGVICFKCLKVFPTVKERNQHREASIMCRPFTCVICAQNGVIIRFTTSSKKENHLEKEHGQPKRLIKCKACSETFVSKSTYFVHFKSEHALDEAKFICPYCNRILESKLKLDDHIVTHTKIKSHMCEVCRKMFPTTKSLKQHEWIHKEVKRFNCTPCKKSFNQRVVWKTHMRAYHPDVDIDAWKK